MKAQQIVNESNSKEFKRIFYPQLAEQQSSDENMSNILAKQNNEKRHSKILIEVFE